MMRSCRFLFRRNRTTTHGAGVLRRFTIAVLLGIGLAMPAHADVLVLGGTGQLGARIVRLLLDAGEEVTVFVRPTSDRSRLDGLDVDYVVGDLGNDADVEAAFESASYRAVVVAIRAPRTVSGFNEAMSRSIVRYAPSAGVEQIIYHGAVGAGDNMEMFPDVPWASVPGLVERMDDQGRAEEIILNSGISATIIRNARVWPDETSSSGNAELTEDQSTLTPITRADLARFTMDCLSSAACNNKVFHASDKTLTWPPPGQEGTG